MKPIYVVIQVLTVMIWEFLFLNAYIQGDARWRWFLVLLLLSSFATTCSIFGLAAKAGR